MVVLRIVGSLLGAIAIFFGSWATLEGAKMLVGISLWPGLVVMLLGALMLFLGWLLVFKSLRGRL